MGLAKNLAFVYKISTAAHLMKTKYRDQNTVSTRGRGQCKLELSVTAMSRFHMINLFLAKS